MASHCAMLEIVSGSESSDSIINISQSRSSGASSFSLVSTTTIPHSIENLQAEVEKLREDKKVLEGRLRGLKALSDLVGVYHKENQELKVQLALAQGKQTSEAMSASQNYSSVRSPFSLVSNQAMQQSPPQPEMNNLSLGDRKPKGHSPSSSKEPAIAHPPVSGPPSYMQESTGPPTDSHETHLVLFTVATSKGGKPTMTPNDSSPRQESLGPMSGKSSPQLLQLDSDKYEEATYEKVGLHMNRGMTGSMYGATGGTISTSREETRPTDFPSLSSGLSNSAAQPPSHSSSTNPPYMAMMHQSQMSEQMSSCLAAEVENITERLSSEATESTPAIAFQMHQIAERISKVEQKERDQKKLIDTLMRENQDLKRQVKMSDSSHQQDLVALREQNTRLMQQVKTSRNQSEETAVVKLSASQVHSDWVHVEKPHQMGDSVTSEHSLVDRVRKLELDKAELQRANSNWKIQWDKLEQKHQMQLSEQRSQILRYEQEISSLRARLAEQTSDFEARMLDMKRHISEEESQKEDVLHQQRLTERRISELDDQVSELRTQLSDATHAKQALAAELSHLKAQVSATGQGIQTSHGGAASSASAPTLHAEIAMLKEQLKVFAEDFEHERQDRTSAQAARDTAKKSAESMARQNHQLLSQIKQMQKQVKDRDDTIAWTLRQNESLQRQVDDYKKKASSEWTEKQNLQRMLSLTHQQLQQQQQQQMQRNPYTTQQNPYNPSPPPRSYQPPPPPQSAQTWQQLPTSQGPEHLPGAWTCSACTYINYPGRTVCESCGLVNSPTRTYPEHNGFPSQDPYGSEHALLMSRGHDQRQNFTGANNGDLVVDSGIWHPPANI